MHEKTTASCRSPSHTNDTHWQLHETVRYLVFALSSPFFPYKTPLWSSVFAVLLGPSGRFSVLHRWPASTNTTHTHAP